MCRRRYSTADRVEDGVEIAYFNQLLTDRMDRIGSIGSQKQPKTHIRSPDEAAKRGTIPP
jgi:hypothetical protein